MAANSVVFNLVVIRSRDLNLARTFYEALGVEYQPSPLSDFL